MATLSTTSNDLVYGVISNIPSSFHSADLRNYFSQFIEGGHFECFHFRHRPEIRRRKSMVKDDRNSFNSARPSRELVTSQTISSCSPSRAASSNNIKTQDLSTNNGNTLCCIVLLEETKMKKFIKMYNNKHWIGKKGLVVGLRCIISRITIINNDKGNDLSESSMPYKTRREQKKISPNREQFSRSDLDGLAELHPPDIMPNGNVGTPTSVFLTLIKTCRFPPKLIQKLGLTFPKSRTNRRYGNVPFDYGGDIIYVPEETPEVVFTRSGKEIEEELEVGEMSSKESDNIALDGEQRICDENTEESGSDDDDDTCEEWERHEALHDDVHSQDRNKERLFEEEMEVVWEKGGSGLVFYTDASYWDAQKGDFDERTTDDWDVDMSVYYEKDGGDKDSRDYVQMRLEQRLRSGEEEISAFSKKIGKFEKHTKGIGRKVLQKHGWKDGDGLGRTFIGISDALDNDGQNPRQKTGLGYYGEKLRTGGPSRKKPKQGYRLTTIYDNPNETDPPETLLRSHYPGWMKYRHEVNFMKARDDSEGSS